MIALFGRLATFVAYGLYEEYITMAVCGISIFAHCYPVYLKFKGGKGVATAFGTLFLFSARYEFLGINWFVLPISALATWLTVAFISKKSSLSALTTALILPVYVIFLIVTLFAETVKILLECLASIIVFPQPSIVIFLFILTSSIFLYRCGCICYFPSPCKYCKVD